MQSYKECREIESVHFIFFKLSSFQNIDTYQSQYVYIDTIYLACSDFSNYTYVYLCVYLPACNYMYRFAY